MFKTAFTLITTLSIIFAAIGLFANADAFYTTTSEESKDFHKQIYQVSHYKDSKQNDILIMLN